MQISWVSLKFCTLICTSVTASCSHQLMLWCSVYLITPPLIIWNPPLRKICPFSLAYLLHHFYSCILIPINTYFIVFGLLSNIIIILWLKLFQLWALGLSEVNCWVLWTSAILLFFFSNTSSLYRKLQASCIFPRVALKSVTSPRSLGQTEELSYRASLQTTACGLFFAWWQKLGVTPARILNH